MPKADLVVYRDQSGAALVSPGTLIASRTNQYIYILNCTAENVTVTVPVKLSKITGKLGLGPRPKGKYKDKLDISRLPLGCYVYSVLVGTDQAEGNSPPRLIIDE
jgi:hypothetical protein